MTPSTRRLLRDGSFPGGPLGLACDAGGNLYALPWGPEALLAVVTPEGADYALAPLPPLSRPRALARDGQGGLLLLDAALPGLWSLDLRGRVFSRRCAETHWRDPVDLSPARDGQAFVSDAGGEGAPPRLWRVDGSGATMPMAVALDGAAGLDLDPTGSALILAEPRRRRLLRLALDAEGDAGSPEPWHSFADHGLGGLRHDMAGNLYVSRPGRGSVAVLDPAGSLVDEIGLHGRMPGALCFGGEDGRTLYVAEREGETVERIRVPEPGRDWNLGRERHQGGWDR